MFRNKFFSLRRRESFAVLAYLLLPLTGFAIFYIIPFGITIIRTFTHGTTGNFVGLDNYISVINSMAFRLAVFNTFRFIGIGVPLLMSLSLVVALLLNTKIRGSDGFRTIYVLPLVIPTASVILVFQIIFERGGIINYLLNSFGSGGFDFLRTGNIFWVLMILYLWKNIGYTIILTMAGLVQIPKDYYEAARVDGAGWFTQLRKITLPLMGPTFFFVMILSIVGAFRSFREAFVLGGSHPHESIYMVQHFMNNNFVNLNYARLSVAAVLTFVIIFAFVMAMYIWSEKGEGASR